MGESGYARSQGCAFQNRTCAIANSALRKETNNSAGLQTLECRPDGGSISAITVGWKSVNRAQKKSYYRIWKKLGHGHPIDFSPNDSGNDERIKMADVIRGEEKGAVTARDFTLQDMN